MLLELQNLGKSFGEHEVLRDVNAGVERGDIRVRWAGRTTEGLTAHVFLSGPAVTVFTGEIDLESIELPQAKF